MWGRDEENCRVPLNGVLQLIPAPPEDQSVKETEPLGYRWNINLVYYRVLDTPRASKGGHSGYAVLRRYSEEE